MTKPKATGSTHEKIENHRNIPEFKEYFKFAVVRNPWDRLVSVFAYNSKGGNQGALDLARSKEIGTDFKKFCLEYLPTSIHNDPQWNYICINNKIAVDAVCRFEHLKKDFRKISKRLKLKVPLPHLRKSEHKPYWEYYDDETYKMVKRLFKLDIKNFKYELKGK